MKTTTCMSAEQAKRLADNIVGLPLPFTVSVSEGELKRTTRQNALLHEWFGQISRHLGDRTAEQVKGECHHRWGLSIRMRNPQFAWIWERTGNHLSYEQQCSLLASGVLSISSQMKVKELSEYMEALSQHYRSEGVYLTDPALMKYVGAG